MLVHIPCQCGVLLCVREEVASNYQTCPRCRRSLARPGQPRLEHAITCLPTPQANSSEAIQIRPYYALDDGPTTGAVLTYDVIELPTTGSEDGSEFVEVTVFDDAVQKPRTEIEEREIRRILARAKQEIRDHEWSRRVAWRLETHGWQCLVYALRASGEIVCLATVLAVLTPFLAFARPTPGTSGPGDWIRGSLLIAFSVPVGGLLWNFLRQVLHQGVMGERAIYLAVFRDFRVIMVCGVRVLVSFLAGPAFIVFLGGWFWVHAGALEWLDEALLVQLGLAAATGWVFLLLAVDARGRLRDAHAVAAARMIRRQGWPGVAFPIVGGLSLTGFVYLWVRIWTLHFGGGLLDFLVPQFFLWCAGLFLWTFLMRWYGIARFRRKQCRPL